MKYAIWLEFEAYAEPTVEETDGCCNMEVLYEDGTRQGYVVWTTDYFRQHVPNLLNDADTQGFATPPDLIVRRITREHITEVLKQLLRQ